MQTNLKEAVSLRHPTRLRTIIWCLLLLLAMLVSLHGISRYQVGTHFDDARYIILARSLLESNQYGMIYGPGEPQVNPYPFGYPLLLAPFVSRFPDTAEAWKFPSLFATLLNATLLFWGWRWFSQRSQWWALAVAALYLLSPLTVDLSHRVMSEPVFTTFVLLTILLSEGAVHKPPRKWWSVAMGTVLAGLLFTRTIGIVFVGSTFVYLLLIRRQKLWKESALSVGVLSVLVSLVLILTPVRVGNLLPTWYL